MRKTNKFCPRVVLTIHLGYSSIHKSYILYDLHSKIFFVSRDIVFREDVFPFKHMHTTSSPLFLVLEFRYVEGPVQNLASPSSASLYFSHPDAASPSAAMPPLSEHFSPSPYPSSSL